MKKKIKNHSPVGRGKPQTRDLFKKMVPEPDHQKGRSGSDTIFSVKKTNVFDMTRAMARQSPPEALKILSGLLLDGTHPLQIMGGLVWFWGKQRQDEKFEKGLRILQAADLNIKRSRLRPDYAVELAVVKLCGVLGE